MEKVKVISEWGTLSVQSDEAPLEFDVLERSGGFVRLQPGTYTVRKHYASKVGGLEYYQAAFDFNVKKGEGFNSLLVTDHHTYSRNWNKAKQQYDTTLAGILLHAASTPDDLEGCIAPGSRHGGHCLNDSRSAMVVLFQMMGDFKTAILKVTNKATG
jgi:hypothetical protein